MKKLHVKLTFTEPVLGTWPSNQNIAREFIASKSPDAASIEDEVAALGADAVADKGMTVFPRDAEGRPVLYDYQVKGFFAEACVAMAKQDVVVKSNGIATNRFEKKSNGNAKNVVEKQGSRKNRRF